MFGEPLIAASLCCNQLVSQTLLFDFDKHETGINANGLHQTKAE